jgi:ABC-type sugar transport system ATPase subunit
VDLIIEDGEWLAIQGPTDHGKTTLLQLLGGLDRPSSGTVEFDGRDLGAMRERQLTKVRAASIGFVFQTFNLVPTLTAQENVEAALVPTGSAPDTAERGPTTRPSVGPPAGGSQAFQRAQELAECMRANGVPNFPDPQPDGSFSQDQLAGLDPAALQQVFLERCRQFSLG